MIIARIIGTVVASQKDERLEGKKLLIVRPINLDGSDTSGYVVAVDTVGAGFHERVLVVAGSSARLAQNMKDTPVDAAPLLARGFRPWTRPVVPENHPRFTLTEPKPVTRQLATRKPQKTTGADEDWEEF